MKAKGDNRRVSRVQDAIRESLSKLLVKSVSDPRLRWITVTGVEVSPDLKNARVYFVVTGNLQPLEEVEKGLAKATPFLQAEVAKNMQLKYTPKLSFKFDKSFDEAAHMDSLIDEVVVERKARPEPTVEEKLAMLIAEAENILIVAHKNPDGDAIGSLLGFSRMLRLMGKKPVVYCPDKVPKVLSFLDGADEVLSELDDETVFNLTVVLDTADASLLPPGLPPKERMGTLAVIDHHATHGDLGDLVIRYEASAVGEMLLDLQQRLVWPMDAKVAECLYTSIVADTGSFRFANTTPATHRAAAELISLGARSWHVATELFESFPIGRQRLLGEVLSTLTVSDDGRYAYLHCTQAMFKKTGASKEDLDSTINYARSIDTVQVAAMFREEQNGDVKVSFRSKGAIDVAAICAEFDGGGHKAAAGCTLKSCTLIDAFKMIQKSVDNALLKGK
jgi:phosphoesterase RecJ-like protein